MNKYTFRRFLKEIFLNKGYYLKFASWVSDVCSKIFERSMDYLASIIYSYHFRSAFEIGFWSLVGILIYFLLSGLSPLLATTLLVLFFIFGLLRYFYWMWCDIQNDKRKQKSSRRKRK